MMEELQKATQTGARNKAILSYRSRRSAMQDLEAVAEEMLLAGRLGVLKELLDDALAKLNEE